MWLGVVGVLGGMFQGERLGPCDAVAVRVLVAVRRLSVLMLGQATVAVSGAVPLAWVQLATQLALVSREHGVREGKPCLGRTWEALL